MKPKSKSELIIIISIFIFIIFSFLIDINKYLPGLSSLFPFILIFIFIFDIYKSNKYLKNIPINEIRIRSNNDSYYILPFIGGVIFCSISIILIFIDETKIIAILTFVSGIILIFKGLIFIPSALIKMENGNIYFENGIVTNRLQIEKIDKIVFNKNNIEFKLNENKNYFFLHLELNLKEIELTKKFLSENITANII
ncbi:hypothetical protein HNP99_001159 [Flavobacterium sp. 28A]|uniref:hypothetical protein n=1 Tax=Flavobacterium sp. 28A TaxID=2735895 RepID=UPI00156D741B|nr:hypothetical protein [Flavobacterium sp. 28A]NRT14815.1 hypothetical protein [Flavobacterium sp. 28A]